MNRRNTKKPPRASALRTVIEPLESRAMLAGVGTESWSAAGLAPAPLGTGSLSSSGIILTCSSPAPGSSGTASPPAPAAGTGTTFGGDLWDSYRAGSGAAFSSSGASGGSSSNLLTLLTQSTEGSSPGGQGNGTGGSLSNADLWRLYRSGAGASSSAGSANGSLASDPTLAAKYTGGAGGGMVFFVTGALGADAAGSGSPQGTTGSTAVTLADGQSTTPLVYQLGSDDGPGVVTAAWTGGDGEVQVVPIAEHLTEPDTASDSANVPRWSRYRTERETITSTVREEPWAAPRQNDIEFMDAAGNRWLTNQGEISAYGPPPRAPTLSQVLEACGSVLASIGAARIVQKGSNSQNLAARSIRPPSLSPQDAGRSGAFNQAKRDSAIPTSQPPERVLPNLDRQGRIRPGRVYEYVVPGPYGTTKVIGIRDDAGGDFYGPGNPQNRGPHFNTESGGHYDY